MLNILFLLRKKRNAKMKTKKILLVEDETIVARDIEHMLQGLGYKVVDVLTDGFQSIEAAKKLKPDLVLMDIRLKGKIDGIEAAHQIYNQLNIPIVYITAHADANTVKRAKVTEPFGYILKPFDEKELQTTIEIALYKFKMQTKLKERERWLSTILKSIDNGVITTNKKGDVTFMNPLAEKLTGWSQQEAVTKQLSEVFQIRKETTLKPTNISLTATNEVLEKGSLSPTDVLLVAKNRKKIPINYRIAPISDEHGHSSGLVISFADVSLRKKAEEELKRSWNNLKEAMVETVQAISFTIETRDPYTAGHQKRVTKLACALAEEMGLTENIREGLSLAGIIHDIGKISVPAEILSKPGPISEVEYSIIQTHPQVGYDILKNIKFPWPIAEIVLQHHERLDGSGYPAGLKGKEILLEARILAVADVVEALSTHRPYRPAQPLKTALAEISSHKGKLYDSAVVDACLKLFKEKNFQFE